MALAPKCRERGGMGSPGCPLSSVGLPSEWAGVPPRPWATCPLELLAWSLTFPVVPAWSLIHMNPSPPPAVAPGATELGCVLSAVFVFLHVTCKGTSSQAVGCATGHRRGVDVQWMCSDRNAPARPEAQHGIYRLEFSGFCVSHVSCGSRASRALGSRARGWGQGEPSLPTPRALGTPARVGSR